MGRMRKGGILLNRAGKGRYDAAQEVGYEVRYIWREGKNKDRENELEAKGAWGAPQWMGAKGVVQSFAAVRALYRRKGFVRYLDHEIYQFNEDELSGIREQGIDIGAVASRMAEDIYQEGYQVAYAVHNKTDTENIHVHFAVNTVNYRTWKKRHENMSETSRRQRVFRQIVKEALQQRSEQLSIEEFKESE